MAMKVQAVKAENHHQNQMGTELVTVVMLIDCLERVRQVAR